MSLSNLSHVADRGELSSTSIVDVLRGLEQRRLTGRIQVSSEFGSASVAFVAGAIVEANMDALTGLDALFRLLGLVDGTYEIRSEPVEARAALSEGIDLLVSERSERLSRWRRLSEHAPPVSAVLKLSPSGTEAVSDVTLPPGLRRLLSTVDGRRTIADIIDNSALDAVAALTLLVDALGQGLVVEPSLDAMAEEREPTAESFEVLLPPAAGIPELSHPPSPSPSGIALRKATVIGMGIATPMPSSKPGAEIRRIISIERSGPSSPLPPPPERPSDAQRSAAGESVGAIAPDPTEQQDASSRNVGRYEILSPIGRGGMGSVYLCRATSEGGFRRLFALKLLRSDAPRVGAAAKRFLEEARLAACIHHPNVVSVIDAGLHKDRPYLVMDYIEGASFKQLLAARPGSRPAELILPIILDALAGLHAAHTLVGDDNAPLGLVHCDVSPENLIIGIDGVCRLTDFGVARHATTPESGRVTHGKPHYLAPEQILGEKVDRRADVFAMGVVLYNALTGTRLFDAPTLEQTLQQVCSQRIEPPSTVGLRPSPSMDFACMRALEREPHRRFATAEEMMMELRRIALRENLLGPPVEVAAWVRDSVGPELAQRRLAILDASRGVGERSTSRAPSSSPISSFPPSGAPRAEVKANELSILDPRPEGEHFSQTIMLPPVAAAGKRRALILAAALAAAAVLATLLWPNLISRMFRIHTEGRASPMSGADTQADRARPSLQTSPAPSPLPKTPPK